MNVSEILSQLQSNEGHVAKDSVLEAVACREEMIPALLNALRDVANNSEPNASDPKSMIFSHAVYLLAQFRESRAYPYLIQMNGFAKSPDSVLSVLPVLTLYIQWCRVAVGTGERNAQHGNNGT